MIQEKNHLPSFSTVEAPTLSWRAVAPARPDRTSKKVLTEAWRACGAFEKVTLAYLAWLIAAVLVFHRNLLAAPRHVIIHVALMVWVAALAWCAQRSQSGLLRFFHAWYFLPLWLFLFEELTGIVHLIFSGWFDVWLIRFDHALTGVYPWDWLAKFSSPSITDVMQFAYMTYFLALVALPALLYAKKEERAFWAVLVSMGVAHYTVYVIAVLLPVESPYHAFAALRSVPLAGGPVTHLMEFIERFGRVRGAAFPSAHVAGAFAALLGAWRYRRWLFWVHMPLFALMVISTVYGRYHYLGDGLAGLLVGAAGYWAGHHWLTSRPSAARSFAPCRR
jgi:membrane-associated phospholipid phosphatase